MMTDLDLHIPLSRLDLQRSRAVDLNDPYVDRFWLPHIGPSSLLLLRNLSVRVQTGAQSFPLTQVAQELGISRKTLFSTIERLRRFRLIVVEMDEQLLLKLQDDRKALLNQGWFSIQVPTRIPCLTGAQAERLPDHLRQLHDDWPTG